MLVRNEILGCRDNTIHHDKLGQMKSDRTDKFGTERSGLVDWLPNALESEFGADVSAIRHAPQRGDMGACFDSRIG